MRNTTQWLLLLSLIITFSYIPFVHSYPMTATKIGIEKRAENDNNSNVNDLHHATITRTTATREETATATTECSKCSPQQTGTPYEDSDDNSSHGKDSSNDNGSNGGQTAPSYSIISNDDKIWWVAVYGTETAISPQMAAVGAILIATGLFLCCMGFRLAKIMLSVMGFLTLASMTWIALANLKPESGYSRDSITMIVVPAGVGVVGAVAYHFLWTIAMYLTGAFSGFIFAVFICCWRSDLVIVNLAGRSGFLGGMGLLFAILVYFAHRPGMLFSTSFVGAYAVMFGIDCLARVGFIAGPQALLNRNPRHMVEYELGKFVYVLLAMVLLLFLLSLIWQFLFNAAYEFGLHVAAAVKGKQAHEEFHENQSRGVEAHHHEEAAPSVAGGGADDHHSHHTHS